MRLTFDRELAPEKIGEFINALKDNFCANTGDIVAYFNFVSYRNTYELYDLTGKSIKRHINRYNYKEQLKEIENTVAIPLCFNELVPVLTDSFYNDDIEKIKKAVFFYLLYETGMFNEAVEEQLLTTLVHYKFEDLDKLIKSFPRYNFDKYVITNIAHEYREV